MTRLLRMSLKEYIYFIARSLKEFIIKVFHKPKKAFKNPRYLFALGHAILIYGLLIPSWMPDGYW